MDNRTAHLVVEALRSGIPPIWGVELYSVGNDRLIQGFERDLLHHIEYQGFFRFINGSWGSGKTHALRLLRDTAFKNKCLVSSVELNKTSTMLNKFESVFYAIIKRIASPVSFNQNSKIEAAPFGRVLEEALSFLGTGSHEPGDELNSEHFQKAQQALLDSRTIGLDFKRIILKYWETLLPGAEGSIGQQQLRDEILQWFSGQGNKKFFSDICGVSTMVKKENAPDMLRYLANFIQLAGYPGLVILFDEAERTFSAMSRVNLQGARDNLLHLINGIIEQPGLILILATTPDFYNHPTHGIDVYGALKGRIGEPQDKPPIANHKVWNLDASKRGFLEYQQAAQKIRQLYLVAVPDAFDLIPSEENINELVDSLLHIYSPHEEYGFWRVLITGLIINLDNYYNDEKIMNPDQLYKEALLTLNRQKDETKV